MLYLSSGVAWSNMVFKAIASIDEQIIISLFTCRNKKCPFCRASFYLSNRSNFKSFPPKKPLLFWTCKQATSLSLKYKKVIFEPDIVAGEGLSFIRGRV